MMNDPWAADLAVVRSRPELSKAWAYWESPEGVRVAVEAYKRDGIDTTADELRTLMTVAWTKRAAELDAAPPSPAPDQVQSARERLDALVEESQEAVHEFSVAVDRAARAAAGYKRVYAKRYLLAKTEVKESEGRMTNGEADMICQADDEVAAAYLEDQIAEALAKTARQRLDHVDRAFRHAQSVYVRDQQQMMRGA